MFELYASTTSSSELVKVIDDNWPGDTKESYNIIKDSTGQITYVAIYPISESGDWMIGYQYFFDKDGNCSIFNRVSNFFNSECVSGIVYEKSTYYFNNQFELICKTYSLLDSKDIDITNELCFFPYRYEYMIFENVDAIGLKF